MIQRGESRIRRRRGFKAYVAGMKSGEARRAKLDEEFDYLGEDKAANASSFSNEGMISPLQKISDELIKMQAARRCPHCNGSLAYFIG